MNIAGGHTAILRKAKNTKCPNYNWIFLLRLSGNHVFTPRMCAVQGPGQEHGFIDIAREQACFTGSSGTHGGQNCCPPHMTQSSWSGYSFVPLWPRQPLRVSIYSLLCNCNNPTHEFYTCHVYNSVYFFLRRLKINHMKEFQMLVYSRTVSMDANPRYGFLKADRKHDKNASNEKSRDFCFLLWIARKMGEEIKNLP